MGTLTSVSLTDPPFSSTPMDRNRDPANGETVIVVALHAFTVPLERRANPRKNVATPLRRCLWFFSRIFIAKGRTRVLTQIEPASGRSAAVGTSSFGRSSRSKSGKNGIPP